MKPKFKIKKTFDGWAAMFTIGVQTFTLADCETKEHAKWYCKMLRIAFKNLNK